MKNQNTQKKLTPRQLAVAGLLAAVSIILGFTGYGFIPLPMAKATIMHIPVIIGAILEGPVIGMAVGLMFGLFSIYQNMTAPNVLSFAFLNPLVSVLPRMLVGLTAYYSYRLLADRKEALGIGVGAAIGSLTNTVGVLGMIYLVYAADFAAARNINPDAVRKVMLSIAVMNGLPEAIISVLIATPVILAIKKARK